MSPAGRRLGDVDDPAILRDDDFGFDHVVFLFAGIPLPLFLAWPLDRLFRAVDDQSFSFPTTDADRALSHQNPDGQSFNSPRGPADAGPNSVSVRPNARQGPKLKLVH